MSAQDIFYVEGVVCSTHVLNTNEEEAELPVVFKLGTTDVLTHVWPEFEYASGAHSACVVDTYTIECTDPQGNTATIDSSNTMTGLS